ncbi:hypothetical protein PsYK624_171410 [Phanerochaete sordida]|uniref:Chromo domain-containing protein n=1 Tax=Phanerochaete sordida TaxID=48140 RepID=A0A9P3GT83_9APHY|nr:hypothetical protein PsYK624_171410 [Phanerochaete sordida]
MSTVNASTGFSPFQLHLSHTPRVIPPFSQATLDDTSHNFGLSAAEAAEIIKQLDTDFMESQDNLTLAKSNQAIQANRHCSPEIFYAVVNHVLLLTLHRQREYMQRGDHRVAKFMNDREKFPGREYGRPGLIIGDTGEQEWPVKRILDHRRRGRGWSFLVRWRGYGPEHDAWIPGSEVVNLDTYGDWLADNEPDALPEWRKRIKVEN